jgi:hypothetical protein
VEGATRLKLLLIGSPSEAEARCAFYRLEGVEGVALMVTAGRIQRIDFHGAGIVTLGGVGVGSTKADVVRVEKGRIEVKPHEYTEGEYLVLTPSESSDATFRIVFETNKRGFVESYRIGRLPEVLWVEGCS